MEELEQAIKERLEVELYYDGGIRRVHPHLLFVDSKGCRLLRVWQVSGFSHHPESLPQWRSFDVEQISQMHVLESHFEPREDRRTGLAELQIASIIADLDMTAEYSAGSVSGQCLGDQSRPNTVNVARRADGTVVVRVVDPSGKETGSELSPHEAGVLAQLLLQSSAPPPGKGEPFSGFKRIPTQQLRASDVPKELREWGNDELIRFALSFDGYEFVGDSLGAFSNAVRQVYYQRPEILNAFNTTGLRALLFFAQRASYWGQERVVDDFTRAVVEQMRKRLSH